MPLRAFLHPVAGDILLLAAWPILLLLIDAEWAYTPLMTIDPWVYFGTFVNLSYSLTSFAGTYYVGRLSWILPGYAMHEMLPPVAANLSLHLAVFYAATFGCYSCLRMTAGRRPALVAALLLGAYQPFIDAVGWDYVDGPGLAYFLLSLAFGTAAGRSRRPWTWNAASGMFGAACVITNLAWLLLMPGYVIYLVVLSPRLPFIQYVRRGLAIGTGALAVIVACAFVNARFTGSYWFFLPSIEAVRTVTTAPAPGQFQTYGWIWDLPSLGTACALLLISLIRVAQLVARGGPRASIALHAVWIWSAMTMLAVQLTGVPVLRLWYYASYLLPGMALAAGDLLARPLERLPARSFNLAIGIGAAIWLLVFASSAGAYLFEDTPRFVLAAALVVLTSLFLRSVAVRPLRATALAGVLVLMGVHQGPPSDLRAGVPLGARDSEPAERQRNYLVTLDALEQLSPIQAEKPFYFWYSDEAPRALTAAYMSISSCYLWGYRLFSTKFPARTTAAGAVNEPRPGQRIVLMTNRREEPEQIEAVLGARIHVVREAQIARGGLALSLIVFDVR